MSANTHGVCRLCGSKSQLLASHIIPKFAISWMKTTGTGYLRFIKTPNKRFQDGAKEKLLCLKCEQLLSSRESYFASEVFKPMLAGATAVPYDQRLAYFVVSLLWRVLKVNLSELRRGAYPFLRQIERVERVWRHFLLNPLELNHWPHLHIFVPDIADDNTPGGSGFNLYCMRALDATIFDRGACCYVFAKFVRFCFIAMITHYDEASWQNTRIVNGIGTLQIPQIINDVAFGGWLKDRATFASKTFNAGVTSNQRSVIRNQVRRKLPTLQDSDLLRASSADQVGQ